MTRTTPFDMDQKGHAIVTKHLIVVHCNVDLQEQKGSTVLNSVVNKGHENVTQQIIVVVVSTVVLTYRIKQERIGGY